MILLFKKIFVLVFGLLYFTGFAITEKDSLINLINKEKSDIKKIDLYSELSWVIYNSEPDLAIKYIQKSILLAEKINYNEGLTNAYNKMGIYEKMSGNYNNALDYYNKSLEILKQTGDKVELSMVYGNIGNVYKSRGNYSTALNFFLKSLKLAEKIKEKTIVGDALLNIGLLYDNMGKDTLALDYLEKSMAIAKQTGDLQQMSRALNNIANILSNGNSKSMEQALEYYKQALGIDVKAKNLSGQASCLNNIGAVYSDLGILPKAEEYYMQSLIIKEKIGDKRGKAVIIENLAYLEQQKKNYRKAYAFFNKALQLADSIGDANLKIGLLKSIAENYYLMGDYKSSADTHIALFELNDSIFNSEMSSQITEMQILYETEKKEAEIQKQKLEAEKTEAQIQKQDLEIDKTNAENQKQRIIIYSIIGGLAFVLILLFILFKMFRDKKIANAVLSQQKEEITAQRDEIEAQRDLAAKQRDLIIDQKQDITDSIEYAYRIQSAIFPSHDDISLFLKDYFILYKPRDIVSGDFYWMNKLDKKIIIIAADCTGHGVPGAFMSMLGIAFLNEIVNKERISSPAKILDRLRENIILALKQHGTKTSQRDGMDVAALTIDLENMTLEFSGANNPLYIIRRSVENTNITLAGAAFAEFKADKMPVSIHPKMNAFSNNLVPLQKNDTLYIFSDGYADQFGGSNGKKFKYKSFKELLISIKDKSMNEQKTILDETFEKWRGTFDQLDDVLVIGVKV